MCIIASHQVIKQACNPLGPCNSAEYNVDLCLQFRQK